MADRIESAIDKQFADDAMYDDGTNPAFPVRVIIDRAVEQRTAFETNLPSHRDELEIRKTYVDRPRRGHTVTIETASGPEVWVFDGLISDDGVVTRHYVNRRTS